MSNQNLILTDGLSFFLSFSLSLYLFISLSFKKHRLFLALLVLPLVLWFRMFLFIKARIATDDEGVLPFPRDLHKISIFEASREKYRRVTRTRWWIPPTKTGPSRFNVLYDAQHKREIVIFTAWPDFAVASRILFVSSPSFSVHTFPIHPRVSTCNLRSYLNLVDSISSAPCPRFLSFPSFFFSGRGVIDRLSQTCNLRNKIITDEIIYQKLRFF